MSATEGRSSSRLPDSAAAYTSPRTGQAWQTVIGLEVHAQLATITKLFCGCANLFGAEPNTATCPVCTGQPGALPVLNQSALELAVRAGLALDCDIAAWSKFDRKNYFYCDLPKGYQISQFDRPYCTGGGVRLSNGKLVRLERIHLEEDAGKAIHDRTDATLVDLNRAGIPLVESVTEPDLESADEALEYLARLKEILRWIGVSDCDMEKGSLRCDVNVSVRRAGEALRTKVECKNLNSFRHVRDAIEHEVARQVQAWEDPDPGRHPVQETRAWSPTARATRTLRSKENAHDYRYFPEPDLPAASVDAVLLATQRSALPELPMARRGRYESELGLSSYDAGVLCASRDVSDFFEIAARLSGDAKAAANWIANDVLAALGDPLIEASVIDELTIRPHDIAELVELVARGRVTKTAARKVLAHMIAKNRAAGAALHELGLATLTDSGQIESWCREALAKRPDVAGEVRAGNHKALGALIGPIMKASAGRADARVVRETLLSLIAAGPAATGDPHAPAE